jgi:hypothetical protein
MEVSKIYNDKTTKKVKETNICSLKWWLKSMKLNETDEESKEKWHKLPSSEIKENISTVLRKTERLLNIH